MYCFIIADMSRERNNAFVYDQRGMGKDADALYTLRFMYHLSEINNDRNNSKYVNIMYLFY